MRDLVLDEIAALIADDIASGYEGLDIDITHEGTHFAGTLRTRADLEGFDDGFVLAVLIYAIAANF